MHELIIALIVLIGWVVAFVMVINFMHSIQNDRAYSDGRREGYAEYDNEKYLKSVAFVEYSEKIHAKDHYHKGYIDGFNLRKSE